MMFHPLYGCLIALSVIVSCLAIGLRCYVMLTPDQSASGIERGLIAFGLGSGAMSLLIFCLGTFGLLYAPLAACLLAIGVLWGRGDVLAWYRRTGKECLRIFRQSRRLRWSLLILLGFSILNGLAALAPPRDVDALIYHLAVPHIYTLHHRIIPLPSIYHSYFPFGMHMLYTSCMLFDSPLAAQCLHVMFGLGTAAMAGVIARRFYSRTAACLAMILFYTLPDVSAEISAARIDLGTSFYALLSMMQVLDICRSSVSGSSRHRLILAGYFAGICAGTKYTALIVLILMPALLLFFDRYALFTRLKYALLISVIAIVFAMPWYCRNAIWTGNPTFPFLTSIFPSRVTVSQDVREANWKYATVPRTIKNFVFSPWILLINHDAFASNQIGPLFLAFLPIYAILRWQRIRRIGFLLVFCLFWSPFWFWTSPLVRFFLAPIAICCIPLAHVLCLGMRYSRWFRYGTISSIVFWLTFCGISNIRYHALPIAAAAGRMPVETFLNNTPMFRVYHYEDFQAVNAMQGVQNILVHRSHGLFLKKPFVLSAEWITSHRRLLERCQVPEVKNAFRNSEITHVLVNTEMVSRSKHDRLFWACMQQTYRTIATETPVYERGSVKFFEIMGIER